MKDKLLELLNNSYCPYSKFRVSSIVVTKDGKEFSGVNVENASYGAGVCAERNAIFQAVGNGYRKGDFKELYVMCDNEKIGMSCMLCRQVMIEFFDKDLPVIAMNPLGDAEIHTISELCPYPFDSEDLK